MTSDVTTVKRARTGENVKIGLKGIEEDALNRGFVICDPKSPVPCQVFFTFLD